MSQDNKFFLFEDRKQKCFKIYKLVKNKKDNQWTFIREKIVDIRQQGLETFIQALETLDDNEGNKFKFEKVLNLTDSDVDQFWYIINSTKYVNRTVQNDGSVLFNVCVKDPMDYEGKDKLTLYCTRFLLKTDVPQTFKQEVFFDKIASIHMTIRFDEEEELIKRKKEIEKSSQQNFPEVFRDYTKIEEFDQELEKIRFSRENILNTLVIDGDMMIVKCGSQI